MSDALEQALRGMSGSPDHGMGFEHALWAAVAGVDEEFSPGSEQTAAHGASAVGSRSPARPRRRWWYAVAAAVVVAAAVAIVASTRHVVQQYQQPPVASAATVVANVTHRLQSGRTLSATLTEALAWTEEPPGSSPGSAYWYAHQRVFGLHRLPDSRITATADGRLRVVTRITGAVPVWTYGENGHVIVVRWKRPKRLDLTPGVPPESVLIYDERSGVNSRYSPGYTLGDGHRMLEWAGWSTGSPLGYPDLVGYGLSGSLLSAMGLRGSVLSTLANGTVTQTTYGGRPALVVTARVPHSPVVNPKKGGVVSLVEQVRLTVDQATWLPLRYVTLVHGDMLSDARLNDVRLDAPVSGEAFTLRIPKGVKVRTGEDGGFRRVTAAEAAGEFGYTPLAPTALPDEFTFAAVATAKRSTSLHSHHDYGLNPNDITQLQYRAGFLSFTVTTRPDRGNDARLKDPFQRLPRDVASRATVHTVKLTGGTLDGVEAGYAIPALGIPHLWAFHDGLLVTVSGDLTKDQLISIAESLAPMK